MEKRNKDLRERLENSGGTTDDIFPNLHPAKMVLMRQKKKLKPVLFLIFIDS